MSDRVLNAPLDLRTIAVLIGGLMAAGGMVWTGATMMQETRGDLRSLRADLNAAIASGTDQRRQIAERSVDMDRRQQQQIDALRSELASQAQVLAEVRAIMGGLKSGVDRIEARLFDPASPPVIFGRGGPR